MTIQPTYADGWPTAAELEAWAMQPLEQLQEAERKAYGVVLSVQRSVRDAPSKATQRAKRPKPSSPRQKAE
jgi:hypothetical protein